MWTNAMSYDPMFDTGDFRRSIFNILSKGLDSLITLVKNNHNHTIKVLPSEFSISDRKFNHVEGYTVSPFEPLKAFGIQDDSELKSPYGVNADAVIEYLLIKENDVYTFGVGLPISRAHTQLSIFLKSNSEFNLGIGPIIMKGNIKEFNLEPENPEYLKANGINTHDQTMIDNTHNILWSDAYLEQFNSSITGVFEQIKTKLFTEAIGSTEAYLTQFLSSMAFKVYNV